MRDVWVVSYPRSGNSLLTTTLLRAFSSGAYTQDPTYGDAVDGVQRAVAVGLLPACEAPVYRLVKTHDPPSVPERALVIGIVRDGRDASLSHYQYTRPFKTSPMGFWEGLRSNGLRWDQWHERWALWMHRRGALVLRYEHLLAFGITPPESFALEAILGVAHQLGAAPTFDALHAVDGHHFRNGVPGEWQSLPEGERLYLDRELAPQLRAWGYGASGYSVSECPW